MAGIKTEREYNIHSFDVNYMHKLLPSRFISYLQDIAMYQSEQIGIGDNYLVENNLSWVIIRYNIKIIKHPKYMDKIKICTFPLYNRKLYAYRKFEAFDENGELISEVDSAWMLIDRNNHKVLKMTDKMIEAYKYKEENNNRIEFDNIKSPKDFDLEKKFSVRYSDIDGNIHVNNTVYVSWAIETMPKETLINYEAKNIELLFKKESRLNDIVTVRCKLNNVDENIEAIHTILNQDGKELCLMRSKWEKSVNRTGKNET